MTSAWSGGLLSRSISLSCFLKVVACLLWFFFFFQAEDGIRDYKVTGVQTCALPISGAGGAVRRAAARDADARLSRGAGALPQTPRAQSVERRAQRPLGPLRAALHADRKSVV